MKTYFSPSSRQQALLRVALHTVSWLPLAWLLIGSQADWLGDNPVRTILRETGNWSLYFLCITLAVTPLRRLTGWTWLAAFRRLPGMYAFLYAALHFATYLWLRRSSELLDLMVRILTRPALLTGFIAFVILAVLAATSMQAAMRWLGGKLWLGLHRLTYVCAVLAVVHFWLEVARYGSNRPLWFGAIITLLLAFRVGTALRQRHGK